MVTRGSRCGQVTVTRGWWPEEHSRLRLGQMEAVSTSVPAPPSPNPVYTCSHPGLLSAPLPRVFTCYLSPPTPPTSSGPSLNVHLLPCLHGPCLGRQGRGLASPARSCTQNGPGHTDDPFRLLPSEITPT